MIVLASDQSFTGDLTIDCVDGSANLANRATSRDLGARGDVSVIKIAI